MGLPDTMGAGALPADPASLEAVDRLQASTRSAAAADGAELARSLGLAAEPQTVRTRPTWRTR